MDKTFSNGDVLHASDLNTMVTELNGVEDMEEGVSILFNALALEIDELKRRIAILENR